MSRDRTLSPTPTNLGLGRELSRSTDGHPSPASVALPLTPELASAPSLDWRRSSVSYRGASDDGRSSRRWENRRSSIRYNSGIWTLGPGELVEGKKVAAEEAAEDEEEEVVASSRSPSPPTVVPAIDPEVFLLRAEVETGRELLQDRPAPDQRAAVEAEVSASVLDHRWLYLMRQRRQESGPTGRVVTGPRPLSLAGRVVQHRSVS